jgi:tRNA(His) guanylyltransferase
MKFDELDTHMRIYETNHDICVLPNIYIVARLDGRNFTRLTRETHKFKAPFDVKFRDTMVETVKHLMNCGFNIIYGYTESDEISLLFHPAENTFSRKLRKLNSVLAGEASAQFSLLLNAMGVFDCRISQLPTIKTVIDYFRWRNEDAFRNSLNAYCYWKLREDGLDEKKATQKLKGISVPDKNELLFRHNINFNDLPDWEKRGIGVYWKKIQKKGYNPIKKKDVVVERKKLFVDLNLPMRDEYSDFIQQLLLTYAQ